MGFSFTVKDNPVNGVLQLPLQGEEPEEFEKGIKISKIFSLFKESHAHNTKN